MPSFRQARRVGSSLGPGMMPTFALGQMLVRRSGYGAMQLAGPYAFGGHLTGHRPSACSRPRSPRVDHIDTAQYYGPGVVNDLIREALHPHLAGWRSSARSRSGETMTVPSSRSTIRTSCVRARRLATRA
jgi:hypothetical protein